MDLTLNKCKKAEITDARTKLTMKASVVSGGPDSLMLVVPKSFSFPPDKPVPVAFLHPVEGVVTCRCRLLPSGISSSPSVRIYRCEVLECLSMEQRREDLKMPLNVRARVTLARAKATVPATLCNISATGVYLVTELAARKGDRLTFDFTGTGEDIPLIAEVLRVEKRPDFGSPLCQGYGCRFVHLSPQYEAKLRSYIFKHKK